MRIGAPVKRITGIRSGKAGQYLCALRGFEAEVDLDGLEVLLLLVLTTPNQINPAKKTDTTARRCIGSMPLQPEPMHPFSAGLYNH